MASERKPGRMKGLAICALVAIACYIYLERVPPSSGEGSSELSPVVIDAGSPYDLLSAATLVDHRHNDGDSFWVKHETGETEFRLYYVDTPESRAKTYRNGENNHRRIAQQGDYFGGLDQKQCTRIGAEAKEFVLNLLRAGKFRVATRWESVYGSPRKYAFVLVTIDGRECYLHEVLVARGFARIHTKPAVMPDGTSTQQQKKRLATIEADARSRRLGAWGIK
ncbi:thermonuclease family protein [Verrucomicrobiaceae bacterium N1E253]|uniref:Thermonuclease family protein n=1 Tax=Oceaniferula marina TaxID=2748318 RepID=A0A851GIK4_9BACT|nr:thermonuclease family protein [Oceaniferula marina]NWK57019.1 thermonuclease family protein [Oceaniferula marina]